MDDLLKKRRIIRAKIVRIEHHNESQNAPDKHRIMTHLEQLDEIWNRCNQIYEDIVQLEEDEESVDNEKEFLALLDRIEVLKVKLMVGLTSSVAQETSEKHPQQVKLPKIELPTFYGDIRNWQSFQDLFCASVHNNPQLSGALKLQYLKSSLKGEAASLVQAISVTDDNYQKAWDLLCGRYDNEAEITFSHLDRLFSQPVMSSESSFGLRKLLDTTYQCVESLKNLNHPVAQWDILLVFWTRKKLDADTLKAWELSNPKGSIGTFQDMKDFLEQRAKALAAIHPKKMRLPDVRQAGKPVITNSYPSRLLDSPANSLHTLKECLFCKAEHTIYNCSEFKEMSPLDRKNWAMQNKRCLNCLKENHFVGQCKNSGSCNRCKKKHHTLLHFLEGATSTSENNAISSVANHTKFPKEACRTVVLPTLRIKVCDRHGGMQDCRALLDSGSQSSFIREDCLQRLGLQRFRQHTVITGLLSKEVGNSNGAVNITIKSMYDPAIHIELVALIVPKITTDIPQKPIANLDLKPFKNLMLADTTFAKPGTIDILLGADVWSEILASGQLRSDKTSLIAQETNFGWVISGQAPIAGNSATVIHHSYNSIDDMVKSFWEVEQIPEAEHLTLMELNCEQNFSSSYSRDSTGRYIVRLPFVQHGPELGSSYEMALRRFKQMERRFQNDSVLAEQYKTFMSEYSFLGHMEEVPLGEYQASMKVYYLPHHAIRNSNSKFRVVFDASAKSTNGKSLNDNLLVGPQLQGTLLELLLRFRMHKIVFTADIAKMYRQILVHPDDVDYQRILWRDSPDQPIKEYRLLTVTYGTSSAPYLATKCLQQLAIDENTHFPQASKVLQTDFYMDDLMTGCDTIEKATILQADLIQLLQRGGFELRKWNSNASELLNNSLVKANEHPAVLWNIEGNQFVKILGMQWCPTSDNFSFSIAPAENRVMTKRVILSDIARIFDPLGWLSPVVVKAKLVLQDLWKLQVSWDEEIDENLKGKWRNIRDWLSELTELRIPRCLSSSTSCPVRYQLHGFSDASESAYAGVVYLRSMDSNGKIEVRLIMAKSKVAPMKTITIPRLELCGALLLARIIGFLIKTLNFSAFEVYCWTDSSIVLAWLAAHPSRWKTFVANRTSKILEIVPRENWHHISGEHNPADCASRGLSPVMLKNHTLWWTGSPALHKSEWSICGDNLEPTEETSLEAKKLTPSSVAILLSTSDVGLELINKFSSLSKLLRVVAYCKRFLQNIQRKREERELGFLTTHELDAALLWCVQQVQRQAFSEELARLTQKRSLPSKSRILSLTPFLDSVGTLRVGGRLRHAKISPDQKFPMLLPSNHSFTELLIRYYHLKNLHAGPELLLACLNQRFWILAARDRVRKVIRQCMICFRQRAKITQQLMADLPAARVKPARAFLKCGVDYCGPILTKASKGRGRSTLKGYIAVFVCFVTRAIHLELVSDLTTDAFLAALKRFFARRGKSCDIYSDCGTNFLGAAKKLHAITPRDHSSSDEKLLNSYCTNEGITWHFNPSAAPHMGGLWEAGVKSVKYHLKRILGNHMLTFEEMTTVLTQIEACLNSRPLTTLSNSPDDLTALTPGHFLIGDALTSVPEKDYTDVNDNRLNRWELIQKLTQHFWQRWHREYITRLQQRPKWLSPKANLRVGQLVLVKEDNMPPLKWRMARITELFPGSDGLVRVAAIKTTSGVVKRPIVKLAPLPFSD